MAELKYWLWLAGRRGIARAKLLELLDALGSPEEIYFAREDVYRRVLEGDFSSLMDKDLTDARAALRECDEKGISILTLRDAGYPTRLANIFDPPLVLYIRGKLPDLDDQPAVAMVGTRSCTPYGLVSAEKLGYEIARCGGVIVTGLARGIDSAAARGALRAGGKVVGVLGCGTDVVYPRSNGPLFADVAASGAIVSEFPPGTPPEGKNFPIRNRVISGLSVGVVLIEAPERSGALITASLALEQGRDVFVVPGNIDAPSCLGSNRLLREGAAPAMCGWDVMAQYDALFPGKVRNPDDTAMPALDEGAAQELVEREMNEIREKKPKKPSKTAPAQRNSIKKDIDNAPEPGYIDILVERSTLTLDERAVLEVLDTRRHLDEIIVRSQLPAQAVLSALTSLEIMGCVTQEPGKFFVAHVQFKE